MDYQISNIAIFVYKSWILFGIVVIFQVSAHWVIIAEERWCMEQFGELYLSEFLTVFYYCK